jgi:hypothetical protein
MSDFHTATNQAVSYIAVFTEHNHQSTAKNLVSLDDKEIWRQWTHAWVSGASSASCSTSAYGGRDPGGTCLDPGYRRCSHYPSAHAISASWPAAGAHFSVTGVTDRIIWKCTASSQYSSSSAYAAMFLGQSVLLGAKELWKVNAPNEFRFFFWLAMQDRCWSSERLARHGLWNNGPCALCDQ